MRSAAGARSAALQTGRARLGHARDDVSGVTIRVKVGR
jgi:hypothetical protein